MSGKRVVSVSKRGAGFAVFAEQAREDRIRLLKEALRTALDLAAQGKLDDATAARLREIGEKA